MSFEKLQGVDVLFGDILLKEIAEADLLKRRDCFPHIQRYLHKPAGKVLLLNGLRRTGKTTLAKQGMADIAKTEFKSIAYIKILENTILDSYPLYSMIEDLYDDGFRYFVIDECTAMLDFPIWAKNIADGPVARGCHVILLGTDSLSLWLSKRFFLEGRYNEIRTTKIPFREWTRLLGDDLTLKDYFYYGGILDFDGVPLDTALLPEVDYSFRTLASIAYYIHTAIAVNIQNALAGHAAGKEFGLLRPLWENGLLPEAIASVVRDQNYTLAKNRLRKKFANGDFYEPYSKRETSEREASKRENKSRKMRDFMNDRKILEEIERRLCIDHDELRLSKEEVASIMKYLYRIDVFAKARVYIMPSLIPEKRKDKPLYHETFRTIQT